MSYNYQHTGCKSYLIEVLRYNYILRSVFIGIMFVYYYFEKIELWIFITQILLFLFLHLLYSLFILKYHIYEISCDDNDLITIKYRKYNKTFMIIEHVNNINYRFNIVGKLKAIELFLNEKLLCRQLIFGYGHFEYSIEIIEQIVDYLNKNNVKKYN